MRRRVGRSVPANLAGLTLTLPFRLPVRPVFSLSLSLRESTYSTLSLWKAADLRVAGGGARQVRAACSDRYSTLSSLCIVMVIRWAGNSTRYLE